MTHNSLETEPEISQLNTKEKLIPWEEFKIELAALNFPTNYNSPEDFISAIKFDFERGGLHIGRRLAFHALELYPEHEQIKYYAYVLAPPEVKVIPSNPERRQRFLADHEWMKLNRLKFIGRWVAIRNGELLAHATSLDELIAQIGDLKGIFFTLVH